MLAFARIAPGTDQGKQTMQSSGTAPNIAIGELLWDLLPEGPRLGGTTANYAILSARLGTPSALVSCVGRDPLGREATDQLARASVSHFDASFVQVEESLPTGTVSVTLDPAGRPRYTIHQPVAWDAIRAEPRLLALTRSAGTVCFGTLAQRLTISRRTIRQFVESTPAACVRICDLNLRSPFCDAETVAWCLQHATVLKVSDEELPEVARLLGDPGIARGFPCDGAEPGETLTEDAVRAARALLALAPDCRLVAITLGPHGSVVADREEFDRHDGFRIQVADTIGAGDAFTAGLGYAYTRGASLRQMNQVSNLCGSYVASQSGATPVLSPELLTAIATALDCDQREHPAKQV
jgi:fructokinase